MEDIERDALIKKIVDRTIGNGGLTFDFKDYKFVPSEDYWYFPKYPGLTAIVNKDKLAETLAMFLATNMKHLLESDTVFGTWVNPQTDKVYIDINTYKDSKSEALATARMLSKSQGRNIVSMYNPVQDKIEYIEH